jgi:hypothetical protein
MKTLLKSTGLTHANPRVSYAKVALRKFVGCVGPYKDPPTYLRGHEPEDLRASPRIFWGDNGGRESPGQGAAHGGRARHGRQWVAGDGIGDCGADADGYWWWRVRKRPDDEDD